MKLSQLLIGLTLSIAIFGFCYFNGTSYQLEKIDYSHTLNSLPASSTPSHFRYESFSRGIATPHFHSGSKISSIADSVGAGACAFDANNDGHIDILTLNGPGRVRDYGKKSWWTDHPATSFYINNGAGFFDELPISGIDSGTPTMNCSIADFNSDGWLDIVITSQDLNYIAINQQGSFEAKPLPGGKKFSTSVITLDYNRDQLPDIYISNYIRYQRHQNVLETNAGFLSKNDFLSSKYQGENNTLLLNLGNGEFKESDNSLLTTDLSRTLHTHIQDINNDNQVDFILANDYGSKNRVYLSSKNSTYVEAENHYLAQKNSTRNITPLENDQPSFILSMPIGSYNPTLSAIENTYDSLESSNYSTWSTLLNPLSPSEVIYINGMLKPSLHNGNISTSQPNIIFDKATKKLTKLPGLFSSNSSRSGLQLDIDNDGDLDLLITNNNGYPALLVNHYKHIAKPISIVNNNLSNKLQHLYLSSNHSTNAKITTELASTYRSAMFNKLINSSYNNLAGRINHPPLLTDIEILMLISFELDSFKYLSCTTVNYIKESFINEERLIRYKQSFIPLLLHDIEEGNPNLGCTLEAISVSRSKYAYDEMKNEILNSTSKPYITSLKSALSRLPISGSSHHD